jgi:DNA-directed RNA polymerase specialized sigma24 family protein
MRESKTQNTNATGNSDIKQGRRLLSLFFLLTGGKDLRIEAATEAEEANDSTSPFFDFWMTAWARDLVIARALQSVQPQISVSIDRHKQLSGSTLIRARSLPPPCWSTAQEVTRAHLQRALLAIDVFPRCALILLVFEGMPIDDVAILLGADKNLIKSAEVTALTEFARNIAIEQGWLPMEPGTTPTGIAAGLSTNPADLTCLETPRAN